MKKIRHFGKISLFSWNRTKRKTKNKQHRSSKNFKQLFRTYKNPKLMIKHTMSKYIMNMFLKYKKKIGLIFKNSMKIIPRNKQNSKLIFENYNHR